MYRYVITQSPSGYEIYVNLISSPAGRYLSRRPYVLNLLKEVLADAKPSKSRVVMEQDMGRVIGNTDIVETSDADVIYYAQPLKKRVFSRFAKNRTPSPSRKLTMLLVQDEDGNYELKDTWIGPSIPPFPGDEHETAKSKSYWENHALVQDSEALQSKTITKTCPY